MTKSITDNLVRLEEGATGPFCPIGPIYGIFHGALKSLRGDGILRQNKKN